MSKWFDVSKSGLRKIQSEKNKFFILQELISNAFDEKVSFVDIELSQVKNSRHWELFVGDDSPDGFKDLTHAYTLFAESYKKGNVKQRGRFNLGEKFALAMFRNARIISTKGSIIFNEDGSRSHSGKKTESGTKFTGEIKLNESELKDLVNQCNKIKVPKGVTLNVCGDHKYYETPKYTFETTLPTIISDEEGNLKNTSHKTVVEVYPKSGDKGFIFELGIPVVECDIDYDINVMQKVPLNKDRDNVSPSYRKKLCVEVLNNCYHDLTKHQMTDAWVKDAMAHDDIKTEATNDVVSKTFGENAVVFDPSDPEANNKAIADGRKVIYASNYNSDTWDNIRKVREETGRFGASSSIPSYATPKFSGGAEELPTEKWTDGMKKVSAYAKRLHTKLFNKPLEFIIHNGRGASACYVRGNSACQIQFFYKVLGKDWFDLENNKLAITRLIIHEFGHYYSSNHLSEQYYDGLCDIGAMMYCGFAKAE